MTATTAPNSATQTASSGFFAEDYLIPRHDTLKPVQVKLNISPSPPPRQFLQIHPSQGDVVLVASLGGGRRHDIATRAGEQTLPSLSDTEEELRGPSTTRLKRRNRALSPPAPPSPPAASPPLPTTDMSLDLQSMAAAGLAAASLPAADQNLEREAEPGSPPANRLSINGADRPLVALVQQYSPPQRSPAQPDPLNNNLQRLDIRSPTTNGHEEELPPMLSSQKSNSNGKHHKVPLPSIRSTLGDIPNLSDPNHRTLPLPPPMPHYGQSPPGGMGLPPISSHASPPISPNDRFRHDMPSPPGRGLPGLSPYYPYQSSGAPGRHSVDYSSSSATETPRSDQSASTPSVAERMSIDNMTNPVGTFVCTFAGCKASPFQTQYLLNSHANVHSSSRPHYCPVKGCPRAEGGKGFKRKNEMIRHGLVHDSPGYVCPFCPDREHKYPRPDNLQRHVRVHHPEKDKDDAALRDVLAQRPDGPSRGRRRRGGQPC